MNCYICGEDSGGAKMCEKCSQRREYATERRRFEQFVQKHSRPLFSVWDVLLLLLIIVVAVVLIILANR